MAVNHWIHENETWSIPREGEEGYIRIQDTDIVMSVVRESVGSKVILEAKNDSPNQKWLRSQGDQEGWFSLKNSLSGLFLNNDIISVDINIQGNFMQNLQLFIKLHNICHF